MRTRHTDHFLNLVTVLLSVLVLVVAIRYGGESVEHAQADATQNVSGFAWSSNIGYINFNCHDSSPGGTYDDCATANYGVHIDPVTGNFSGFAWSSHIGYIRFDPTPDPVGSGCTVAPCARLNLITNNVSGWARACDVLVTADCTGTVVKGASNLGGWDGWIKLSDPAWTNPLTYDYVDGVIDGTPIDVYDPVGHNGVYYDPVSSRLKGFAWGSLVVGWVDFAPVIPPAVGGVYTTLDTAPSPPIITGPTPVDPNVSVGPYTFTSTDPNNDNIFYLVDWGDGSPVQRLPAVGTVISGFTESTNHTWPAPGSPIISAVATDVNGNVSGPGTYAVIVNAIPDISVTPLTLGFGGVEVNTNSTLTFTVTNTGGAGSFLSGTITVPPVGPGQPFTLSDPDLGDPSITCSSTISCTYTLIPGGSSALLDVTFNPTVVATGQTTLVTFDSTFPSLGDVTRQVQGDGIYLVSGPPEGLNFGNVVVNRTKDLVLRITNSGAVNIGPGASLNFPFPEYTCLSGCPFNIPPGTFVDVTIRFQPTAVERYDGNSSITPPYDSVVFPFLGAGVAPTFQFRDQ
ncbi:MAG: choice-of-anchor D domain-containing protein [Parcubacteria group bacterium]|nr:choice-of-anchor D domain-containing protein [Parcubacteria group bacterium]